MRPFVRPGAIETDGERGHRIPALPRAQPQHHRRVEPATDIADHRHIPAQPALDGKPHQGFQLVDQRRGVIHPPLVSCIRKIEVPVLLDLDPAVAHTNVVPRRNRLDSFEKRSRSARAERVEKQVDPLRIRPGVDHARSEQCLDLRSPEQPAVSLCVIERADPHSVPPQDQLTLFAVPNGHCELPPSLLEEAFAMIFVKVGPQLGVAARRQPVPAFEQFLLKFGIFEELTILCDPHRAVFIADRLSPPRQVDDREPARSSARPGSI